MQEVLDGGPGHHHPGSILPPGGGSDGWQVGQAMKGCGVDVVIDVAVGVVVDVTVVGIDRVVAVEDCRGRDMGIAGSVAGMEKEGKDDLGGKVGVGEGAGLKGVNEKQNFLGARVVGG